MKKNYSIMDRTMSETMMVEAQREEKQLSEEIFLNLHALTYLHEPSAVFRSHFSQDMFIKSNPKAFPHVMHYLFTILDPIEFKKRFYWPLDKESENLFRSTTVQYLNELNEKYNMGFEPVKSFIVVLPGGKKFMKVVLSLSDFVMQEELRKNGKLENIDDKEPFSRSYIEKVILEKNLWIKTAQEIIDDYDSSIKKLRIQTDELNLWKNKLFSGTSASNNPNLVSALADSFHTEFSKKEKFIVKFNKEYQYLVRIVQEISQHVQNNFIDANYNVINVEREKLEESLKRLSINAKTELFYDDKLNAATIFEIVEQLLPLIYINIGQHTNINIEKHQNEIRKIDEIYKALNNTLTVQKSWHSSKLKSIETSISPNASVSDKSTYQLSQNLLQSPYLKWTDTNLNDSSFTHNTTQLLLTSIKKSNKATTANRHRTLLKVGKQVQSNLSDDRKTIPSKFQFSNFETVTKKKKLPPVPTFPSLNESPLKSSRVLNESHVLSRLNDMTTLESTQRIDEFYLEQSPNNKFLRSKTVVDSILKSDLNSFEFDDVTLTGDKIKFQSEKMKMFNKNTKKQDVPQIHVTNLSPSNNTNYNNSEKLMESNITMLSPISSNFESAIDTSTIDDSQLLDTSDTLLNEIEM